MSIKLALSKYKIFFLLLLLISVSVFSYLYFLDNAKFSQVQGIMSSEPSTQSPASPKPIDYFTPMPSQTIEIGADTSSDSRSQILESAKSADELKNFYKNFFYMQDWDLIDESTQNNFYILEFRQGTKSVKITISSQDPQSSTSTVKQPVLVNVQEFF